MHDQAPKERTHDHDEGGGAEQPKWWLEAPPTGGWQFRTEMQPSSFIEKEYQLYRYEACYLVLPARICRCSPDLHPPEGSALVGV